jgi:hypothetical protein
MKMLAAIAVFAAGLLVVAPWTFAAQPALYLPQQPDVFPSPGEGTLNVHLYLPAQPDVFPSPGEGTLNVKLYMPAGHETPSTIARPQDDQSESAAHDDILQ